MGANLKYIDEEDLQSKKVRVLDPAERRALLASDSDPDADDLIVMKRKSSSPFNTASNRKKQSNLVVRNSDIEWLSFSV